MEEMRGRILRRRKKRKIPTALNSKKKSGHSAARGPGRPCSSFTHPASVAPPAGSQPPLNSLTPPTTNINNNISINIGSSGGAAVSRRQHCPYCGRHFRSLARHLEKYHANQPEVRTAMELAHLHSHSSSSNGGGPLSLSSHSHSFAVPQPSPSNSAPPSLFQRERESPAARLGTGNVSFSLSLSPPSSTHPAAPKKSCSLGPPAAKLSTPSMASRVKSPSPPPPPPASTPRRGRRLKRENEEQLQHVDVDSRNQEELRPPPTPEPDVDPDEDLELSGEGEDDAPEKNGELVRFVRSISKVGLPRLVTD